MADDVLTRDVIAFARQISSLVHHDDVLERFWSVQPDPPAGVTVEIDSMGNNPERVRSFTLRGRFDVATLHAAADDIVEYGRAEEVACGFEGVDPDPAAWAWRADHSMQHSGTVDEVVVAPFFDVDLAFPDDPRSATQGTAPGPYDVIETAPVPESVAAPSAQEGPTNDVDATVAESAGTLIGAVEPVPPLEFEAVLPEAQAEMLERLRSVADELWEVAGFEMADPGIVTFGASPAFAPVIDLMVDGMRLGFMVDAPELCEAEPYLCAFGFTMEGFRLVDHGKVLGAFAKQCIVDVREIERSTIDQRAWEERALDVLRRLGHDDFGQFGERGFGLAAKRGRPLTAPSGSKWRNDSSGNGVLAAKAAWGTSTVKRPGTIANGLKQASAGLAPAAALYCAQEALVLANAANDPASASDAYAAMVEPLTALGRSAVAARAAALADIPVAR